MVGNEAVGKTSLVRYLVDGTPRDEGETRTSGIEKRTWTPQEAGSTSTSGISRARKSRAARTNIF